MTNRPDEPHDDWLRAALRHAPDAQVEPPEALSAAILRAARDAVRPQRRARPWRAALRAAWGALARPPVAAGLASVMLATVIGVMWMERPQELHEAAAPTIERSTQRPPQPAVEAAREPARATSPQPASAPIQAAPRQPQQAPKPKDERRASAAPAPASVAEKAAVAQDAARRSADAAKAAESEARADASATPSPALQRAPGAVAGRAAPAPQAQQAGAPSLVTGWHDAIAREPGRWRWSLAGGAPQPVNDALRGWLAQLASAARDAWHPASGAGFNGEAIELSQDGRPVGTIRLDAQHVQAMQGTRVEQAELGGAEATALRDALAALPR
ncbi:hypothetical protein [Caldimonas sp. KR1-144]|uniref:hypothetical protein n=1 Tax=Caldimonas sp. KR1-144 TaxID=3400911 RepID=UPI003C078044